MFSCNSLYIFWQSLQPAICFQQSCSLPHCRLCHNKGAVSPARFHILYYSYLINPFFYFQSGPMISYSGPVLSFPNTIPICANVSSPKLSTEIPLYTAPVVHEEPYESAKQNLYPKLYPPDQPSAAVKSHQAQKTSYFPAFINCEILSNTAKPCELTRLALIRAFGSHGFVKVFCVISSARA